MQIDRVRQLRPGVTQLLVAHHQGLPLGVTGNRVVEGLTDGLGEQGFFLGAAAVALAWVHT